MINTDCNALPYLHSGCVSENPLKPWITDGQSLHTFRILKSVKWNLVTTKSSPPRKSICKQSSIVIISSHSWGGIAVNCLLSTKLSNPNVWASDRPEIWSGSASYDFWRSHSDLCIDAVDLLFHVHVFGLYTNSSQRMWQLIVGKLRRDSPFP